MGPAPSKHNHSQSPVAHSATSNISSPSTSDFVLPKTPQESRSTKEHQISHRKRLAKRQIEEYYRDFFSLYHDRRRVMAHIDNEAHCGRIDQATRLRLRKEQFMRELQYIRRKRKPFSISNFQIICKIGQGSFGEVLLVRDLHNGELYAMKKLTKTDMICKRQVHHVWLERFVLASVGEHPLVVKMHYSFHDQKHLYFVMEYVPGGDMMTMLIRRMFLPESWARFYIAELAVAIDALHRTGIIHRDIKPDNILFRKNGHICLSDFGLSKSLLQLSDPHRFASSGAEYVNTPNFIQHIRRGEVDLPMEKRIRLWKALAKETAFSRVGTPTYIAPEVLQGNSYSESCDWWSVGVILFEMLVGYPPFHHRDPEYVRHMICHWRHYLRIPKVTPSSQLSDPAKNLIFSLLREAPYRLGARRGLQEFKEHCFFEGIDWDRLSDTVAPFIPTLKSDIDTSYFEENITGQQVTQQQVSHYRQQNAANRPQTTPPNTCITRKRSLKPVFDRNTDVEFVGFTYVPRSVGLLPTPYDLHGSNRDLCSNSAQSRADQRSSTITDARSLVESRPEAVTAPVPSTLVPIAEVVIANADVSTTEEVAPVPLSCSIPNRSFMEKSTETFTVADTFVGMQDMEPDQNVVSNDAEVHVNEVFRESEEEVQDEIEASPRLGGHVGLVYSPPATNDQICFSYPYLAKYSRLDSDFCEDVQDDRREHLGEGGVLGTSQNVSWSDLSSAQNVEDEGTRKDGVIRRMSTLTRDEEIPVFSTKKYDSEHKNLSPEEAKEIPNESEVNRYLYEASRGMNSERTDIHSGR